MGMKALFTVVLAVVYVAVFSQMIPLTDEAEFGGDTWEYQSMAVNFATGHDIARFGGVEDFAVYKFDGPEARAAKGLYSGNKEHFMRAGENGGVEWFYRTPGYYMFLGVLYKAFGISPLLAKQVQLLLLCIVAASLPWIGLHEWKTIGFWSGCIASPVTIASIYRFSAFLYTESLITFAVFLIVVTYEFFEARRTLLHAFLVGFTLGVGLLMKASLLFIPPLLGIFLLVRWFRTKKVTDLLHLSGIGIACILTIAPWSVYASRQSGKFILLSTQTEAILLDAHNEYVKDGLWYQEWRDDPRSFYNNDGLEGRSAWVRVANFYRFHPLLLPRLAFDKLIGGFRPFPFLLIAIAVLAGDAVILFCRRAGDLRGRLLTSVPPVFLIIFLNFIFITILTYVVSDVYPNRIVKPMDFLFILLGVHLMLSVLCAGLRPFFGKIALLQHTRFVR